MEKKVELNIEELPKTIVRRLVKDKLSQCSPDQDISVHKDSLLAFCESARIFIHYLSATSNDICRESRRQTIKADDVFKALEDIEFPELVRPLKASLDEFRRKNAGKKAVALASKEKEMKKRRKIEEEPVVESADSESKDAVEEDEEEEEEEKEEEEDDDNNEDENGVSDD